MGDRGGNVVQAFLHRMNARFGATPAGSGQPAVAAQPEPPTVAPAVPDEVPVDTALNLFGRPVRHAPLANLRAIEARPARARPVKVQDPEYKALRRKHSYYGVCCVQIREHPGLEMLCLDDDMVAYCYFYFGPDAYEPLSVYLFSQFSRSCQRVLDIGAFTGLFGLVAAKANPAAEVICFEPIPNTAKRAEANALLNRATNLSVSQTAISGAQGRAVLTLYGANLATTGASLMPKDRQDVGHIDVAVDTVDHFTQARWGENSVDLIKLDTEGDEVNALMGAAATLALSQPIVISEVLSNAAIMAQTREMARHGYHASFIDEKNWRLLPVMDATHRPEDFRLAGHGYGNLLFFHPARHRPLLERHSESSLRQGATASFGASVTHAPPLPIASVR